MATEVERERDGRLNIEIFKRVRMHPTAAREQDETRKFHTHTNRSSVLERDGCMRERERWCESETDSSGVLY